jgi:hypothetical protein
VFNAFIRIRTISLRPEHDSGWLIYQSISASFFVEDRASAFWRKAKDLSMVVRSLCF